MKYLIVLMCLMIQAANAAEATSSDKFAQVRGFKVEISGRSLSLDNNQNRQLRMIAIEDAGSEFLQFKSLPIANAQIMLKKGNQSTPAKEAMFHFQQKAPMNMRMFDVLHFRQEEGGLVISAYRILEKDRKIFLVHSGADLESNYHEIKASREHGSGLATGRRSAGLVCQGIDCFIHKEIYDIRTIIKKFIQQHSETNLEFIRRAEIPGAYPQSLVSASNALENLSSMSIMIGEDMLWNFNFSFDQNSSLKSNPLYQGNGNSGQNPLFEAKSNLRMQSSFGEFGIIDESFRCENNGLKQKKDSSGGYLCGSTDHL
jgi:hypothetical protein